MPSRRGQRHYHSQRIVGRYNTKSTKDVAAQSPTVKSLCSQLDRLVIKDDVLYRRWTDLVTGQEVLQAIFPVANEELYWNTTMTVEQQVILVFIHFLARVLSLIISLVDFHCWSEVAFPVCQLQFFLSGSRNRPPSLKPCLPGKVLLVATSNVRVYIFLWTWPPKISNFDINCVN